MPLALILNELLTNAVKHGADRRGRIAIKVELRELDDDLALVVTNSGPGFERHSSQRRASGLGLVEGLARRMGGKFEVERAPGARCTVRVPKARAYPR